MAVDSQEWEAVPVSQCALVSDETTGICVGKNSSLELRFSLFGTVKFMNMIDR